MRTVGREVRRAVRGGWGGARGGGGGRGRGRSPSQGGSREGHDCEEGPDQRQAGGRGLEQILRAEGGVYSLTTRQKC